jgi:quercetin dioxygenase-like cupin family protein
MENPGMFAKHDAVPYALALPGIDRRTLCYGARMLMTEFRLQAGHMLPTHAHPQEQTGYLVSGRMQLRIGAEERELAPGDSWSIPGGVEHGATILEDSVALEVFSPVREDYLPQNAAQRGRFRPRRRPQASPSRSSPARPQPMPPSSTNCNASPTAARPSCVATGTSRRWSSRSRRPSGRWPTWSC